MLAFGGIGCVYRFEVVIRFFLQSPFPGLTLINYQQWRRLSRDISPCRNLFPIPVCAFVVSLSNVSVAGHGLGVCKSRTYWTSVVGYRGVNLSVGSE